MTDPLREIYRYHYWATFTLIDHLKKLSPERLNDSVPGTAGSIQDTLTHLVSADRRYLELMTGEGTPRMAPVDRTQSLDQLRSQFEAQTRLWDEILDHVDAYDPTLPGRDDRPETPHVRNLLMTQAIHHGNDHRTHICTILGATGQDVPDIDEWSFWFSDQH